MSNQGRIRLLTRGDDLGSFQAANEAIVHAYKQGLLRNTSVMVPAPHFHQGVEMVKAEKDLCIGLHITLNAEWDAPRWGPVSPPETVRSLIDDDGYFLRDPARLMKQGFVIAEAVREVQAQLDVLRSTGLDVRYIDEHMGVGWIFHAEERCRLGEKLQELAQREGLIWHTDNTQFFPRVPDLRQPDLLQQFEEVLSALPDGNYVHVTHPSYDTAEMQSVVLPGITPGKVAQERQLDHDILCSPIFADLLQRHNIDVIRFDQVEPE